MTNLNKKIMLIDADSKIPNLALMKLSTYYKNLGYIVNLLCLSIPYFPHRNKYNYYIKTNEYEKVFCSIIFDNTKKYIDGENIIYGGTGFDLTVKLPDEIENCDPDYSIYPDNHNSYGFISRGCVRKCYFCKVWKKEGGIKQVNTVDKIKKHDIVIFLDNNILALPNHKEILQELVDKKIKCKFCQGLDIRLVDKENSHLLKQLKYVGEYSFAFDNISLKKLIEEKLLLLEWRRDWELRFFVYIHPKMPLSDTIQRIEFLKEHKILPYVMRDISCYSALYSRFYNVLMQWVNGPQYFKKISFDIFMNLRYSNKHQREIMKYLYNKFK